ncbi:MAG: hypothetical protein IJ308_04465 [Clostridia bacterium]|nr:hypothetical protein [Clostridia bacterium]
MGIEKIDKNFIIQKGNADGKAVYEIPHHKFGLHGVFYEETQGCFARVPFEIAQRVNEGVAELTRHTSGGRICFSTDSQIMQITARYKNLWIMSHMPLTGSGSFTLCEVEGEQEKFIGNFMPISTDKQGFTATLNLKGGTLRNYVLYFPLYNDVQALSVALDENARVEKYDPYRDIKPILYYGSSITQGGCANRTDGAYQALICKRNRVDFINLGFSGSAKGEDVMTDYLASIDCSLFVCDYDHNAPNAAHLQATHFRLYERYRKQRPDVPILFITKPDWQRDAEGDIRHQIIKNTYLQAKKLGDKKVYFLSGKVFYGKKDAAEYAVDGCHPTDRGFHRMAEVIYKKIRRIYEDNKI